MGNIDTLLSVREIENKDVPLIAEYWLNADDAFLQGMGVDLSKMPEKDIWYDMLQAQVSKPYTEKQSYATIWEYNGDPIGHCNVNKIIFGKEAYMHLHIWNKGARKSGYGVVLVKKSLRYFFNNLKLQAIYCEPYALNPAPNQALKKLGFELEREYVTIPGFLNFEQPVNRWVLTKHQYGLISK